MNGVLEMFVVHVIATRGAQGHVICQAGREWCQLRSRPQAVQLYVSVRASEPVNKETKLTVPVYPGVYLAAMSRCHIMATRYKIGRSCR